MYTHCRISKWQNRPYKTYKKRHSSGRRIVMNWTLELFCVCSFSQIKRHSTKISNPKSDFIKKQSSIITLINNFFVNNRHQLHPTLHIANNNIFRLTPIMPRFYYRSNITLKFGTSSLRLRQHNKICNIYTMYDIIIEKNYR